jgi:Ca2+:H+ antiporter
MIGLWFTLRTHASIIWATEEHHSHQPQHSNHLDSGQPQGTPHQQGEPQQPRPTRSNTFLDNIGATGGNDHDQEGGGHDAPNWSRMMSSIILLTATVAYAIIAEVFVDTVDSILENVDFDEKFLGLTLFALVPKHHRVLGMQSSLFSLSFTPASLHSQQFFLISPSNID